MPNDDMSKLHDDLQARGLWAQFVQRRDELKGLGLDPLAARTQALAEVEARAAGQPLPPVPEIRPVRPSGEHLPVDMRTAVEWAFSNMGQDVNPNDEPTPGAYDLLQWAKKNDENKAKFYAVYVPKLLPSKGALEAGDESFKDDGRKVLSVIDRLKESKP